MVFLLYLGIIFMITHPIKTNRLVLSPIALSDLEAVHTLNSYPEVDRYNTLGIPTSLDETQALVLDRIASNEASPRQRYTLKIEDAENPFMGMIGINLGKANYFSAEIWYKLHPDYWNQGFASEALTALLHFGFTELKLHRIEAGVATGNIASIKVLEKCGFQREGNHRQILPIRGEWVDNYSYGILSTDKRITPM